MVFNRSHQPDCRSKTLPTRIGWPTLNRETTTLRSSSIAPRKHLAAIIVSALFLCPGSVLAWRPASISEAAFLCTLQQEDNSTLDEELRGSGKITLTLPRESRRVHHSNASYQDHTAAAHPCDCPSIEWDTCNSGAWANPCTWECDSFIPYPDGPTLFCCEELSCGFPGSDAAVEVSLTVNASLPLSVKSLYVSGSLAGTDFTVDEEAGVSGSLEGNLEAGVRISVSGMVVGNVNTPGDLHISGTVDGTVTATEEGQGFITIGSAVEGSLSGNHLYVHDSGHVICSDRIRMSGWIRVEDDGVIEGSLSGEQLEIYGAGRIICTDFVEVIESIYVANTGLLDADGQDIFCTCLRVSGEGQVKDARLTTDQCEPNIGIILEDQAFLSGHEKIDTTYINMTEQATFVTPETLNYDLLRCLEGAELVLEHPLVNTGLMQFGGGLLGTAKVSVSSEANADIQNDEQGEIQIVAGSIPVSECTALSSEASFSNRGKITVRLGRLEISHVDGYTQEEEGRTWLSDVIYTDPSPADAAIVVTDPSASIEIKQNGLLEGTGTLAGKVINEGTLTPGFLPEGEKCMSFIGSNAVFAEPGVFDGEKRFGEIVVEGDYEQKDNGELVIDLSASENDVLTVSGTATLGGRLTIRVWSTDQVSGQQPTPILYASSISGSFEQIPKGFKLLKSGGVLFLTPARRVGDGQVAPPDQKQFDSRWGDCGLGEPRCCDEVPGNARGAGDRECTSPPTTDACSSGMKNQSTIGDAGCVLTAACMVANSMLHGGEEHYKPSTAVLDESLNDLGPSLFNNSTPTVSCMLFEDPWQPPCGTYSSCRVKHNDVVWDLLASNVLGQWHSERISSPVHPCGAAGSESQAWENLVAGLLWNNVPVPVTVETSGGTHTVVAWAVEIDQNGRRRILINDPGKGATAVPYLDQLGLNVAKVEWLQPGVQASQSLRLSNGDIIARDRDYECPAEIMAIDESGRRTGYDPSTGIAYTEIPGSSYSLNWPNALDDDPDPPVTDRDEVDKILMLSQSIGEEVRIKIIATESIDARLDYSHRRSSGEEVQETAEYVVPAGAVEAVELAVRGDGDVDQDGDIDSEDYAEFFLCFEGPADLDSNGATDWLTRWVGCSTGPNVPVDAGCTDLDLESDGDLDLADYALLQMRANGPFLSRKCAANDFDADGDVDISDYAVFQRVYTGCLVNCNGEQCGNGVVQPWELEECDPPDGVLCRADCTQIECGDGVVEGNEECDPPDGVDCSETCTWIICGDGVIEGQEECDPPDGISCDENCKLIGDVCGPGRGDCFAPHPSPGCEEVDCCSSVCDLMAGCCETTWDELCVQVASYSCIDTEACCASGVCYDMPATSCTAMGGFPQGASTTCATVTCVP